MRLSQTYEHVRGGGGGTQASPGKGRTQCTFHTFKTQFSIT